jgi:hypothetical protein
MNLTAILRVLGVKITPEQIAQLEVIIPQIPARSKAIIEAVNQMIERNDAKMDAIVQQQQAIRAKFDFMSQALLDIQNCLDVIVAQTNDDVVRSAGAGGTGKLLEMTREGSEILANSPGLPKSLDSVLETEVDAIIAAEIGREQERKERKEQDEVIARNAWMG